MKKMTAVFLAAGMAVPMTVPVFAETAVPSQAKVLVNGEEVVFSSYTIEGNTYFKLREIDRALDYTVAGFKTGYDKEQKAIVLTKGPSYISNSTITAEQTGVKAAVSFSQRILLNGEEIRLTAYTIDGYNYFKLQELGDALGFDVAWDNMAKTISIEAEPMLESYDVTLQGGIKKSYDVIAIFEAEGIAGKEFAAIYDGTDYLFFEYVDDGETIRFDVIQEVDRKRVDAAYAALYESLTAGEEVTETIELTAYSLDGNGTIYLPEGFAEYRKNRKETECNHGKPFSLWSDIYGIGVVTYRMDREASLYDSMEYPETVEEFSKEIMQKGWIENDIFAMMLGDEELMEGFRNGLPFQSIDGQRMEMVCRGDTEPTSYFYLEKAEDVYWAIIFLYSSEYYELEQMQEWAELAELW